MTTEDEIIEEIFLYKENENYSMMHNDKVYRVGSILFYFLEQLKLVELSTALSKVSLKFNLNALEVEEVSLNFTKFINHLQNGETNTKKSYINLSITLFNEKITNQIANMLSFFFTKRNIVILPVLCTCVNLFYYTRLDKAPETMSTMTASTLTISYGVLLIIMIAHEFGHAAASKSFGVNPKEIGLGIYFIFPVLYSNVTRIWILPKQKRLVVNIAGIYIQLIFNTLLIITYYITNNITFGNSIYFITKINIFVALYSLQPFIRNDGYWLYSDFFDIPNLNKKSILFLSTVARGVMEKGAIKKLFSKENIWLTLYSIGNIIFIISITITFMNFTVSSVVFLSSIPFTSHGTFLTNFANYYRPIFSFLFCLILIFIMVKNIYYWIKISRNELQKSNINA